MSGPSARKDDRRNEKWSVFFSFSRTTDSEERSNVLLQPSLEVTCQWQDAS